MTKFSGRIVNLVTRQVVAKGIPTSVRDIIMSDGFVYSTFKPGEIKIGDTIAGDYNANGEYRNVQSLEILKNMEGQTNLKGAPTKQNAKSSPPIPIPGESEGAIWASIKIAAIAVSGEKVPAAAVLLYADTLREGVKKRLKR